MHRERETEIKVKRFLKEICNYLNTMTWNILKVENKKSSLIWLTDFIVSYLQIFLMLKIKNNSKFLYSLRHKLFSLSRWTFNWIYFLSWADRIRSRIEIFNNLVNIFAASFRIPSTTNCMLQMIVRGSQVHLQALLMIYCD